VEVNVCGLSRVIIDQFKERNNAMNIVKINRTLGILQEEIGDLIQVSRVFFEISECEGITASEIARRLSIKASPLNRYLLKLQRRTLYNRESKKEVKEGLGLIKAQPSTHSRKEFTYTLTPKGRKLIERLRFYDAKVLNDPITESLNIQ
jgi:DNA-binding MarR family transcriptional regulator